MYSRKEVNKAIQIKKLARMATVSINKRDTFRAYGAAMKAKHLIGELSEVALIQRMTILSPVIDEVIRRTGV